MSAALAFSEYAPAQRGDLRDETPVLFASSIGSSRIMWSQQVAAVSAHRRMIAFDHRGHGSSPTPDGPYEIADLAGDVLALMDSLGIERADFVGLSLGGMVGMWLGAHHPERIRRLVLACTTPHMPPPELWIERAALVEAEGMEAIADSVLARWFTEGFVVEHPGAVLPIREQFLATSAHGYAQCGLAISRMDQRDTLARITAPTLVIAGTSDPATTPEVCQRLADAIPGSRYAEVDAAHIAAVEAVGAFTSLILDHLSSIEDASVRQENGAP